MRPLFAFAVLIIFVTSMGAEEPFAFATVPGKLPKQVAPGEYAIRIVPNIEKYTFDGSEVVELEVRTAVHELVLNAADMEITAAKIDNKPIPSNAITIDNKSELLRLALSTELAKGSHTLSLKFSGKINQQGRG